jgi:hypothetical protein
MIGTSGPVGVFRTILGHKSIARRDRRWQRIKFDPYRTE